MTVSTRTSHQGLYDRECDYSEVLTNAEFDSLKRALALAGEQSE